jgi:hypothetical protein
LAARFTGAHVLHLLYRRPGKVPGQRVVEWLQSVAIANPGAFRSHFTGHSCSIQIRAADPWNFDLSDRTRLSIFHLDKKDAAVLAGLHFGNARGDRAGNGNVPFRARDDCFERCRLRYRNEQAATSSFRGATHGRLRETSFRHLAAWQLNSTDAKAHVTNRLATETLF